MYNIQSVQSVLPDREFICMFAGALSFSLTVTAVVTVVTDNNIILVPNETNFFHDFYRYM